MDSCCTCASILPTASSEKSEKTSLENRRVDCCGRLICGQCIISNTRFAEYCPYCQISTGPSPLPQGLREPPSYYSLPAVAASAINRAEPPPSYTPCPAPITRSAPIDEQADIMDEKHTTEDTLHFLNHEHDSITSLSLRYGVPAAALRQANQITSDHLLLGRRTILIPGQYYKSGVSLSPRAIEGEDEELRKTKVRRFMTFCKVSDYDEAVLYLEQADYDISAAIKVYFEDDAWESAHQTKPKQTNVQRKRGSPWRLW
ncbi:unnamed protein product [Clonostachys rhizophaga]|uniref:LysM domain-containing protein n=1 Tax=Clonostachys rhizophaga TaxID=160324 RepID=A0A9P0ELU5_9HYPO|nr:unnamed protein product [Clonostachys rhizophaga]